MLTLPIRLPFHSHSLQGLNLLYYPTRGGPIIRKVSLLIPASVMLFFGIPRFKFDIMSYGDRFTAEEAEEALADAAVTRGPQITRDGQLLEKIDYLDFAANISGFQRTDHK